jgi:hypothetical protein
MSPSPSAKRPRRGRLGELWPLGLYLTLSVALFGVPVIGHLGSHVIAADQLDSSADIWFLAWWPHALLHGLNPFVTHAMFYPAGYNLTWATSMPLPAMVAAPITLGFGPAVSWNLIELAAPALSAWTAFLLCRHVVGRPLPSLIGGYVFGFSPYMLVHLTGSPMLALVPLLPVFVLLVLKRVEGSISARRFVVAMVLSLAAQYLIYAEVLVTSTLFGAVALLVAFVLYTERRRALLQTVKLLAFAYAAALVFVSPFLYYFFFGRHYPPGNTYFPADLSSFVLPLPLEAVKAHSGSAFSSEAYLGLPLIALIVLFVWQRRRSRPALLAALSLAVAGVACLGGELVIHGHRTGIMMPWRLLESLPVLRYVIPVRLAAYVTLPAALIVSMWLAEPRSSAPRSRYALRWGLAVLAVAFIAPAVGNEAWNTAIADPAFFQHHAYRAYLKPSAHVLTVPVWGPNERWLADAGFPFALSAGYAGQGFPASYTRYPIWNTLLSGRLTPDYGAQLRRFIAAEQVTAIVVQRGYPGPWETLFGSLGVRPVSTGGVRLYRVARSAGGAT